MTTLGASPDPAAPTVRVTFGVIVLNGEPFLRYCLRSLYQFAHEILVVEGASPMAAGIASADGHSADGTLATLRAFKEQEDPEDKVRIVTAEDEGHPDGFWPGDKDEQSRAYAKRATGDYLWQVDSDEFYRPDHIGAILALLGERPQITAVSFKMLTFWGSPDYVADGWFLRRGADCYHRLFRWGRGYHYVTHRPPTVTDALGRDARSVCWVDAAATARLGVNLYHYSLLFPRQVHDKCRYYRARFSSRYPETLAWMNDSYLELRRPYRVHNVYSMPSWLDRFEGQHPPEVTRMMEDIRTGEVAETLRRTDDVETLLDSWWYPWGRGALKAADHVDRAAQGTRAHARRWRRRVSARRA